MTSISLNSVHVDFPIYDIKGRSLRRDILRLGIGGRISSDTKDHVVIKALDGVSVEVREGQRMGIIGHNGAGKSTLLRVMAGIYEPLSGDISVVGRVVTMFDMMLGMDVESTGYENILLRGMFLGIGPREIALLVDEIAEFSDLGEYLSMPIRAYSSGMLVRLAFAISTSVQPDILIMDEMIGAGDSAFIQRADKRLEQFVDSARILVVASHSEGVIRQWCTHALLLNQGKVQAIGRVDEVLAEYAASH